MRYIEKASVDGALRTVRRVFIFSLYFVLAVTHPSYGECWRAIASHDDGEKIYVDLDTIKDTRDGMHYKMRIYNPDHKYASQKTGFLYLEIWLQQSNGGNVSYRQRYYDWYHDKWLLYQFVKNIPEDEYTAVRFGLMEAVRKEGRTGW